MLRFAFRIARGAMKKIYVYQGYGMYEKDSVMLHQEFTSHLKDLPYSVDYITPEQIKAGELQKDVALLAIGGGFDLGLIKALGQDGMTQIRDYVESGGRYLGICSGAYFASGYIEFDKGGPLEVVGERFLRFYPGVSSGPIYKKYVYNSTEGAVTSLIYFDDSPDYSTEAKNKFQCSRGDPKCTINGFTNEHINGFTKPVKRKEYDNDVNTFHANDVFNINDENKKFHCNESRHNGIVGINLDSKSGLYDPESRILTIEKCTKNNPESRILTTEKCTKNDPESRIFMTEKCIKIKASTGNPNSLVFKSDTFSKPFKVFFNGGGYFTEISTDQHLQSLKNNVSLDLQRQDNLKVSNGVKLHKYIDTSAEQKIHIDVANNVGSTMAQCELGHCRANLICSECNKDKIKADSVFDNVTVLSRYLDLPNQPVAVVKCKVDKGIAVLSFAHFEYDSGDVLDDLKGPKIEIKKELELSRPQRKSMFKTILKHLGITELLDT